MMTCATDVLKTVLCIKVVILKFITWCLTRIINTLKGEKISLAGYFVFRTFFLVVFEQTNSSSTPYGNWPMSESPNMKDFGSRDWNSRTSNLFCITNQLLLGSGLMSGVDPQSAIKKNPYYDSYSMEHRLCFLSSKNP